jgi:polyisoprenoid-binding protein YceI
MHAALALLMLAVATGEPHEIDTAKSRATFSVRHVFVDRVTGTIPIASGSVTLAPDAPCPLAVTAQLKPGNVSSGDRDRDASLASADFFDAKTFPLWTFAGTNVAAVDARHCTIDGNLTIHGVTQPVELAVVVQGDSSHPQYHAVAHVDRHLFGMAVTRLDPAIGATVDITLDVTLK